MEQDLNQISPEAGCALFHVRSVTGTDIQLKETSNSFCNHALAIKLLSVYLRRNNQPISAASSIPDVDVSIENEKHPRRVLTALTTVLDPPETELLRVLGLFDQPADLKALGALRLGTPIANLTSNLHALSEADWLELISRLRRETLISPACATHDSEVGTHPLIKKHFREQLKETFTEAWSEGHKRLYEYFKASVEMFPRTVERTIPLFRAVHHGCEAGLHQQAFDEVYWLRIHRSERVDLANLGPFSLHFSALSEFFQSPWSSPIETLRGDTKLEVLDLAALCTWALGNPVDAEQLFLKASVDLIANQNYNLAARTFNNLSAVSRIRGQFGQASAYALEALKFAESNEEQKTYAFRVISAKVTLADALHQVGRTLEAQQLFEEAEEMHQEKQRHEIPFLYGREGNQYSDFLLDQGEFRAVQRRVELTLRRAKNFKRNRHVALDSLSLGRAFLMEAKLEEPSRATESQKMLEQAVNGLRRIGMAHHLPPALLAYSDLLRFLGKLSESREYAEEAEDIAVQGMMCRTLPIVTWSMPARISLRTAERKRNKSWLRLKK